MERKCQSMSSLFQFLCTVKVCLLVGFYFVCILEYHTFPTFVHSISLVIFCITLTTSSAFLISQMIQSFPLLNRISSTYLVFLSCIPPSQVSKFSSISCFYLICSSCEGRNSNQWLSTAKPGVKILANQLFPFDLFLL